MPDSGDDIQLVSSLGRCHADLKAMIESGRPGFLSRIGGSDTDVVIRYFDLLSSPSPGEAADRIQSAFGIVRRYNGYYDKERSPAKIAKFCDLMIESYRQCDQSLVVGANWLSAFFPASINPTFHVETEDERPVLERFLDSIAARHRPARFYPYPYVERILHGEHTLFRTLSEVLPGKTVLAVTPFEQSIQSNFANRRAFFPDYDYPDFALATYNTPITYEGLPAEFYPDLDWFDTLERMKREISTLDFDVALLSCGSYAVPLGLHIRDVLKRAAIYVGGCLQLYFGIMGRRYDNPWFLDQINIDAFIPPLERERYLSHINIAPEMAREAFGAYF